MNYWSEVAMDAVNPKPKAKKKIVNPYFAELYANAQKYGAEKAAAAKPVAMVVGESKSFLGNDIDYSKPVYVVPDGPCGFAWVKVRPGNCPFAKWLVSNGLARGGYDGGVDIWISAYGQSMARKEAHAYAMAEVFSNSGIKAYGQSRMD